MSLSPDRILGIGGLATAGVGLVLHVVASANPELEGLDVPTAILGFGVVVLLVAISVRHRRRYPGGPGDRFLKAAWILTLLAFIWLVLISVDPALEGEGSWTDRLPSLEEVAGISRLMLPIPLGLASLGILKDVAAKPYLPEGGPPPPPKVGTSGIDR